MQRFALGAKLCRLASIGTVLELAAEALGRSGKKLLIKLDGYRCIAVKRGREVTLFSRHKKVLNRRFLEYRGGVRIARWRFCSLR